MFLQKRGDFSCLCHYRRILVNFHIRVLETTSNAASSVHSKKSKIKHQAEAEKQKAEAEAKAAKDREEVGPNCSLLSHSLCCTDCDKYSMSSIG